MKKYLFTVNTIHENETLVKGVYLKDIVLEKWCKKKDLKGFRLFF